MDAKNKQIVNNVKKNVKDSWNKTKKAIVKGTQRAEQAIKTHEKKVNNAKQNFNRKVNKVWSSSNSGTSRSTTAAGSVSGNTYTNLPWLKTDSGRYTAYGLGALGLLAAGIYGAKEIRNWNNLYSEEPKTASLFGIKTAAPINYTAAMNSVKKLQAHNKALSALNSNISNMQDSLFNKYLQNSKRLSQNVSGFSTSPKPEPGLWTRLKNFFFKGGELKSELFDTDMIKKASRDIHRMTMIKLSNYEVMEKIANPLGISTGAQLMQHISNSPMTFLTNLRKSIQSGKFINNIEPLKKFRAMYGKNPNLLSMGNRMGFTGYLDNYLAGATQGIGRPATAAAASSNAARVQRAIQKSRIGSATNGIPYFGAYIA